jgi:hypothetical protein
LPERKNGLFLGEALAFAIEAKAKAEAEQMAKKADAWKEYKEAAMVSIPCFSDKLFNCTFYTYPCIFIIS